MYSSGLCLIQVGTKIFFFFNIYRSGISVHILITCKKTSVNNTDQALYIDRILIFTVAESVPNSFPKFRV